MRYGDESKAAPTSVQKELPIFPRLQQVASLVEAISRQPKEPAHLSARDQIRLLEAKVEYLLDETYRTKSLLRLLPQAATVLQKLKDYQVSSFDYQWADIVYHDEFLSNEAWRKKAPSDVAQRLEISPDWFRGKKILDCGCGPGRHAWVFGRLGASVTAFDLAERALTIARKATMEFPNVTIDRQNISAPLPYATDFDLVWCYGVLHHTGDTFGTLANIARHVRPGGCIYLMLYAEPRRSNIFDYQYQHEVTTLREATRHLTFDQKAKVFEQIEGPGQTLAWFDAISSEINDLYTFEEIVAHLSGLGFEGIRRTMPHETMHNVVATRTNYSSGPSQCRATHPRTSD